MTRQEKLKHFKLTIGSVILGLTLLVVDGYIIFLIILPLLAFAKEFKLYDHHNLMENKGMEWRKE